MEQYKILIVDDLPKNIMVLGNNLLNENYQIAYARSGQEAIDLTLKNNFDLILLDIMMPGIDGFETCKRILSNPLTAKVPIIFITAKNDYDSIVKGFDAGAKDYVTKPFNSKELLARVRTHLELKRNSEELEILNQELERKVLKRTEQLRMANEKIKRLDEAKSSFLGIISHEVRTPLNGIFGSVEMLKDLHSDEETQDIIEMMSESAERLLTFSELSTLIAELNIDQYELAKNAVQLHQLVHHVKDEFLNKLSDNHQVEFELKHSSNEIDIIADKKLIQKVISDVIHNSIRFNEENVKVTIEIEQSEEHIIVKIEDNGVGFPQKVLPGVFEVFQANSDDYVEGKGLNLAAAKLILDAHNGMIEACNLSTGGAQIRMMIPRQTEV